MNMLASLALTVSFVSAVQEPTKQEEVKKPVADRSAEATLKKVFEYGSKLKNIHVFVNRWSRDEEVGAMYPDNGREIWYEGPSKFRYETFSYWGDCTLYIADGEKLIVDGCDGEVPVVFRDLKPTLYDSSVGLNQQGNDMTLLSFILAGQKGMDELVKKDGFIKSAPCERGEVAVTFETTNSGTATFYWRVGNEPRVHRIEFDNKEFLMSQYKLYPEWISEPKEPLVRDNLSWLSVGKPLNKKLFTASLKDREIDDQRTKKKKS